MDTFFILGEATIDHILLGLITSNKEQILGFENQNDVLNFFKEDLIKDSILDGISNVFLIESLDYFTKEQILKN